MTWKTSTAVWRRSTVSPEPAHLRFWVQMEPSSYKRTRFWRGGLLNKPSSIYNKAIELLLQVPVNVSLDITPSLGKVQIVIRQLSSDKAPGSYSIPAEIYKEGGSALTGKLLILIQIILVKEELPQDFKDASIIYIYKRKGNQQACDNHQGIKEIPPWLSHAERHAII